MKPNIKLTLLGTSACHLCESAQTVLATAMTNQALTTHCISVENIDIMDNEILYNNYCYEIPVLLNQTSANMEALKWPFTREDIVRWVYESSMTGEHGKQ